MPVYAVKTVVGREEDVAELIYANAKKNDLEVFSVFVLPGIKGFVFVEASSLDEVYMALRGLYYIKGLIKKEIPLEEIVSILKKEEKEIEVKKGDIVEIIAGPFKGEKAKVIRVDSSRDEITVEILGAVIPIPVTLKKDNVRVIKK